MVANTNKLERANGEPSFINPRYEVRSEDNTYLVEVYMPGVAKDDSTITLEGDSLLIEATRKPFRQSEWKTVYREMPESDYRLRLQLNVDVDPDAISAKSEAGILTVTLPVAEKAVKKVIHVS